MSVDGHFSVSLNDGYGSENSEKLKKEEELKKIIGIMILLIAHWTGAQELGFRITAEQNNGDIIIPTSIANDYKIGELSSESELHNNQEYFYLKGRSLYFKFKKLEDLLEKEEGRSFSLMFDTSSESFHLKAQGVMTHDHRYFAPRTKINEKEVGSFVIKIHNGKPSDKLRISNIVFSDHLIGEWLQELKKSKFKSKFKNWQVEDYKKHLESRIKLKPYDVKKHGEKIWILTIENENSFRRHQSYEDYETYGKDYENESYYDYSNLGLYFYPTRILESAFLRTITLTYKDINYEINVVDDVDLKANSFELKYERGPNWTKKQFSDFLKSQLSLEEYLEKNPEVKGFSYFKIKEDKEGRTKIIIQKPLAFKDFESPFEIYGLDQIKIVSANNQEVGFVLNWIKKHLNEKLKENPLFFLMNPGKNFKGPLDIDNVTFSKYGSYRFGDFELGAYGENSGYYYAKVIKNVTFGDGDYLFSGIESFEDISFGKGSYAFFECEKFSNIEFGPGDYLFFEPWGFIDVTFGEGNYTLDPSMSPFSFERVIFQNGVYEIDGSFSFKDTVIGPGDFYFRRFSTRGITSSDLGLQVNYKGKKGVVKLPHFSHYEKHTHIVFKYFDNFEKFFLKHKTEVEE